MPKSKEKDPTVTTEEEEVVEVTEEEAPPLAAEATKVQPHWCVSGGG